MMAGIQAGKVAKPTAANPGKETKPRQVAMGQPRPKKLAFKPQLTTSPPLRRVSMRWMLERHVGEVCLLLKFKIFKNQFLHIDTAMNA